MEIKRLAALSEDDLLSLGEFGYTSMHQYEAIAESTADAFSIRLNLVQLNEPFVKQEPNDGDDAVDYGKMAKLGYSFGMYEGGKLIALAVSEPQRWNNTLLIWHFQVHKDYKRQGCGTRLMEQVVESARRGGFRAVTLETQNTNVAAIRFYRQCGFTIEGIDLSLYSNRDTGKEEIALFMRRKLENT
ncbi:GNAT family N-acetyltransferase [Cohnella sp.]|uniref:GNAT family N-acetyltransferase n=1 Tax=Cohnella sp. TaxID=1883426 RepID=UPI0035616463